MSINNKNKKYMLGFFGVLTAVVIGVFFVNTVSSPPAKPLSPVNDNTAAEASYVTVKDTEGNVILETGLPVYVNDEFIDENNIHYIIFKIDKKNAVARIKNSEASAPPPDKGLGFISPSIPAQARPHHVVIYHTHTDESYTPTSGKASEPGSGDVLQVGSVLKQSLNKTGISATHSLNRHDPHDINAYHRSRRTLVQLLKESPDAAFDIHRDSAPPEAYLTSINGVSTGRIMIVIGRSNPNMQTNLDYARRVKAAADTLYPGLTRGIFMGKGDYNQDLYPTALLFEVGTEGISQDEAEKAVYCLADTIAAVLAGQF
ncbi:MAG: stage II sporulation protein P [Syntrophomonadaceae bacterium]|nr:stage II sporulation protein P [Syntrophomonadaceae bacterium]